MKKTVVPVLCVLIFSLGSAGNVDAHTFALTGTIRDLTMDHPDFQRSVCGLTTGLVEEDLGADKKPSYGPNGENCIQSVSSFYDWYHQSESNQSTNHTIVFDNGQTGSGGTYTFNGWSFFPIDNQLYGNEGLPHNYHFTFEVHSSFVYSGGETFSYYSDDDLWVFIDNQRVVDVGGIHYQVSGVVSLDALGLVVGERYDFDLFFAERHTDFSTLVIQTSIVLGLFSDGFETGDMSRWSETEP